MGKLNCECGWQISDVASPCNVKGWLLTDHQLDEAENFESCEIIGIARDVWECSKCGRIAFGNIVDNTVKWYTPVDGKPGHLNRFNT